MAFRDELFDFQVRGEIFPANAAVVDSQIWGRVGPNKWSWVTNNV